MTTALDLPPALRAAIDATKEKVARLHAELPKWGLVVWTAGNVSERVRVDDGEDLLVIKPSGLPTTS
jgi:L-ribulose-5-phosphate 4-epimerase